MCVIQGPGPSVREADQGGVWEASSVSERWRGGQNKSTEGGRGAEEFDYEREDWRNEQGDVHSFRYNNSHWEADGCWRHHLLTGMDMWFQFSWKNGEMFIVFNKYFQLLLSISFDLLLYNVSLLSIVWTRSKLSRQTQNIEINWTEICAVCCFPELQGYHRKVRDFVLFLVWTHTKTSANSSLCS